MPFDVDATNFFPFVENLYFGTNNADGFSPIVFDDDGSIFVALFGSSGVLGFASTDTRDAGGTPIEAGQPIEVVRAEGNHIVVKPSPHDAPPEPQRSENKNDILAQSAESLGIEPLDDPLG